MWCGAFSILTILHLCSFEAIQDMDAVHLQQSLIWLEKKTTEESII